MSISYVPREINTGCAAAYLPPGGNGAQKLLGVLITIGEAVAYVVSGMYGDVRDLGAGNAILIIVQVSNLIVVLDSHTVAHTAIAQGFSELSATNLVFADEKTLSAEVSSSDRHPQWLGILLACGQEKRFSW
eukprot:3682721-Pyramimonas_sp.AAC.1